MKYHYSYLKVGAANVPDQQVMASSTVDAIMAAFVAAGWTINTFSAIGEDQYSSHITILWESSNTNAAVPTAW